MSTELVDRLKSLKDYITADMSQLLLSRLTTYEDAFGEIAEHVEAENIVEVQNVLADKLFVALYLGFIQGHTVGLINDKSRLQGIVHLIQNRFPKEISRNSLLREIQIAGVDHEEQNVAAFKRGYTQALEEVNKTLISIGTELEGSTTEDFHVALVELGLKLTHDQRDVLAKILT